MSENCDRFRSTNWGDEIEARSPLARVGIVFGLPAELENKLVRHLKAIGLAKWLLQLL